MTRMLIAWDKNGNTAWLDRDGKVVVKNWSGRIVDDEGTKEFLTKLGFEVVRRRGKLYIVISEGEGVGYG